jgi:hypothetical protein
VQGSTSQVFAESSALSTFAPGNRTTARISYEFPAPIGSGPLSARVWFYLPSSVTLNGSVVIVELHDPTFGATGKASINLGVNDTVILEATTGITPAVSTSANNAFSRDAWNCAVLRATVSDVGALEVEINGATVHSISGGDVLSSPGFSRVMVGLYKLGTTDVQMYFDEVSVAQAALTCP